MFRVKVSDKVEALMPLPELGVGDGFELPLCVKDDVSNNIVVVNGIVVELIAARDWAQFFIEVTLLARGSIS